MKVLVAVKRVIDYNVRIRVKADHCGVETENVKMSINPFDEMAVESALKLKEKGQVSEVIVTSIGSVLSQEVIRHALALGADRGILIEANVQEPLLVAKCLKALVNHERPDLVILGKQAIDDDCNQTGQMLAALLGWPQGTCISDLVLEQHHCQVETEVDAGLETLKLTLPAVLTTDLRLNQPRYATLPNIMKAKSQVIEKLDLVALGLCDLPAHQKLLSVEEPKPRPKGVMVSSVEELVDKLKNEAGVLP